MALNGAGTSILTRLGGLIDSGTLLSAGRVNTNGGFPFYSLDNQYLYFGQDDAAKIQRFLRTDLSFAGELEIGCFIENIAKLAEMEDGTVLALGDDVLCASRMIDFLKTRLVGP